MEAAGAPLGERISTVHGRMPADLETLHKGLEQLQVDDVVLDYEHIDRGNGTLEEAGR